MFSFTHRQFPFEHIWLLFLPNFHMYFCFRNACCQHISLKYTHCRTRIYTLVALAGMPRIVYFIYYWLLSLHYTLDAGLKVFHVATIYIWASASSGTHSPHYNGWCPRRGKSLRQRSQFRWLGRLFIRSFICIIPGFHAYALNRFAVYRPIEWHYRGRWAYFSVLRGAYWDRAMRAPFWR